MNSSIRRFFTSLVLALAVLLAQTPMGLAAPKKKVGRDRLAEALRLLNEAKESTSTPTPLLYEAKEEVEGTLIPHKETEHEKAVKAISEAITAVTQHANEKEAIGRAIAAVRTLAGMNAGAGNKKKKK